MNPFYIIWIVLFASYCSCQNGVSKTTIITDSESTIRCDTYLYNRSPVIAHTWAIHNFSLHEANGTSQILSSELRTPVDDRFAWIIKVIPNGIDGKNETISLYVFLCDIREVTVDTNISIINHQNETLHSEITMRRKMGGSYSYGPLAWTNFCKKDDLFRNQMLQNDTLTLSINIKWYPESPVTVDNISHQNRTNSSSPIPETTIIKCDLSEDLEWILKNPRIVDIIFSTNGSRNQCDDMPKQVHGIKYDIRAIPNFSAQVHEIKYIWAIHNFSIQETLGGYREIFSFNLQAPTTDKYVWYIKLTPTGHYSDYGKGKPIGLDVYLSKQSNATKAFAKYDISIINREKKVLLFNESSAITLQAGNSEYWQNFSTKNDLRRDFLINDTLTLFIHIKWVSDPCNVNVPHQHDTEFSSPAPTPDPVDDVTCNLSQILESMLENPKFADVVFTTNGSSYPAHKNILAARSPVFATMFQEKDIKHGNKTTRIRINFAPVGEEVLRAMLRYIYTGKCENLSELADKLFVVAAKYGLDGLRKICEQTLCKTVSAENAAAMLEFAKQHQAEELKSKAMQFIENVSDQKSNTTIH